MAAQTIFFNSIPHTLLGTASSRSISSSSGAGRSVAGWSATAPGFASGGTNAAPRTAPGWASFGEWYRFILFGRFPYAEQWGSRERGGGQGGEGSGGGGRRTAPRHFIFIAMSPPPAATAGCGGGRLIANLDRRRRALPIALMSAGFPRHDLCRTLRCWERGRRFTLILAVFGMIFGAFTTSPSSLALGPALSAACRRCISLSVAYIRASFPRRAGLINQSIVMPGSCCRLFPATGTTIDKLLRAQIPPSLSPPPISPEIIRGGLQRFSPTRGVHDLRGGRRRRP